MNLSPIRDETVIQTKAELYAVGNYDLLDLFPKQAAAMELLASAALDELLFGGAARCLFFASTWIRGGFTANL